MLGKHHEMSFGVAARPSEAVEFYLYFFMMAYLIVFERRIHALETEGSKAEAKTRAKKN